MGCFISVHLKGFHESGRKYSFYLYMYTVLHYSPHPTKYGPGGFIGIASCAIKLSPYLSNGETFMLMTLGYVIILTIGHLSMFKVTGRKSALFMSVLYLSYEKNIWSSYFNKDSLWSKSVSWFWSKVNCTSSRSLEEKMHNHVQS